MVVAGEEEMVGGASKTATGSLWAWCNDESTKTYGAVVLTRLIYAGMYLVSTAAFDGGMNPSVLVFYRQVIATVVLAPLALFIEWKHAPPLSLLTFCKIFVLALVGAETLKVGSTSGRAKLLGIVICMCGVASLAFYEGPHFKIICLFKLSYGQKTYFQSHTTWIKGCFLMLSSCFAWSIWLVFQAILQKSYPPKLLFTSLQCALGAVQSFVVAIVVERDPNEWKLDWDMKLVAVVYCGVVVTGVTYYLQAWVIEKTGPVFLAMSTPLAFIFTMICSALLCQFINIGSILGGVLLVGGLYSVLWAKVKEEEKIKMELNEKKITPNVEAQDRSLELTQVVTIGTHNNANPTTTTTSSAYN